MSSIFFCKFDRLWYYVLVYVHLHWFLFNTVCEVRVEFFFFFFAFIKLFWCLDWAGYTFHTELSCIIVTRNNSPCKCIFGLSICSIDPYLILCQDRNFFLVWSVITLQGSHCVCVFFKFAYTRVLVVACKLLVVACEILFSWSGTAPRPLALGVWSHSHWKPGKSPYCALFNISSLFFEHFLTLWKTR